MTTQLWFVQPKFKLELLELLFVTKDVIQTVITTPQSDVMGHIIGFYVFI